ncbi:MAG TPA: HAD family hydrolase [Polyangia bacterium]|jgi:HAD superfamily hydrolase (TIGR01490 family)|nr:HAD family hydrolase [Polyangia bacterium]
MSRTGAFFDVDRTLVACNTGRLFLRDLRRRGEISFLRAARAMGWMAQYHLSLIDLQIIAARVALQMRGKSETEFAERCRRWVEDEVLPLVVPGALRQIEKHRAAGHVLAVLSSSPIYVTRPLAQTLGIEEVLSTTFEVEDDKFTGRLIGPACVGTGKIHWAESLGARRDVDLEQSFFYTDSYTDMPMLERVGNQVIVNPDPRLRLAAKKRGWPVQDWSKPPIEVRA